MSKRKWPDISGTEVLNLLGRARDEGLNLDGLTFNASHDGKLWHELRGSCSDAPTEETGTAAAVKLTELLEKPEEFCINCVNAFKSLNMKLSTWALKAQEVSELRDALMKTKELTLESAEVLCRIQEQGDSYINYPPLNAWISTLTSKALKDPQGPRVKKEEIARFHRNLVKSALPAPAVLASPAAADLLEAYNLWLEAAIEKLNRENKWLLVHMRLSGRSGYMLNFEERFTESMLNTLYWVKEDLYLLPGVLRPWVLSIPHRHILPLDEKPSETTLEALGVLYSPYTAESPYKTLKAALEAAEKL